MHCTLREILDLEELKKYTAVTSNVKASALINVVSQSNEWTKLADCGGFYHVEDAAFELLHWNMEWMINSHLFSTGKGKALRWLRKKNCNGCVTVRM